jgi:hypothetical protein
MVIAVPKYRRKMGSAIKSQDLSVINSNSDNFHNIKRATPETTDTQRAVKYAEAHEDELAQHGPVRVLWRNGKPVGQQA